MKILRIESKNFKPFDNISIPYEGYLGEGFFIIKGKNSMGKTSIIESILWGLLGEHLMAEKDRKSIIKTGESKCEVAITFEISDILYRVIRTIEVIRKRKSLQDPQNDLVKSSALLFKKEKNEERFIQLCRGPNIVNQEIESLLGVYPEVIEKTVYIRQKEVDKLALADPSELRELIKNLFGLNDFDDHIKKYLKNQINSINEEIKDLKIQIGSLLTEQNELEKQKQILKEKKEKLELKLQEIKNDKNTLISYPSQDKLNKIKVIIENIEKYKKEVDYKEKMYNYKKENVLVQENRIKDFQDKIFLLNSKILNLSKELQEYPPKDRIRKASDILKGIDNDEKQIRNLISKSNQKLNIDIQNISINNVEELNKVKEKNQIELEKTDKERISILAIMEGHKKLLTSNQLLYEIQNNSIKYIQDRDKCPICNSKINDKNTLIFDLKQARENIFNKENSFKKEINQLEKKLKKIETELDEKKGVRQLIEVIVTIVNGLIEKRFNFYDELNSISEVYKKYDELKNLNSRIIDDLISSVSEIENNIFSSKELVKNFKERIESEKIKLEKMKKEINIFNKEKNDILLKLQSNKLNLQTYCDDIKVSNIHNLLANFYCNSIDELISKRLNITVRIEEKAKIIENIQEDISYLTEEIEIRGKKIISLRGAEEKLKEKEYLLKHVLFLLGEIDGFISNDIVEGRLSDVLMNSTNFYLIPFTEGRYEIANISSTMRKIKDRISHGLTLTLVDNKDHITKNKEQLSGGDESALGLALRISISKLMSTIRPFKHVEKKVPMINFIIMDEPMTSLDEFRRNVIMNILMKDQSFKQIFLISHAEINDEENNYHSIVINDNENSKRMVEYFH
ncbi:MAG TPA: SMC family ATPase [Nitrososphaeraceae archaeon]|nr:SMC family ATPase [Nitrososphaeraceae archaeon]